MFNFFGDKKKKKAVEHEYVQQAEPICQEPIRQEPIRQMPAQFPSDFPFPLDGGPVQRPQMFSGPRQMPVQTFRKPMVQTAEGFETEDLGRGLSLEKRRELEEEKAKNITPKIDLLFFKTDIKEKFRKGDPCNRNKVEIKESLLDVDTKYYLCGQVYSSNEDVKALSTEEQEKIIKRVKDAISVIKVHFPEEEKKEVDVSSLVGTKREGLKLRKIELKFVAGEYSYEIKSAEDVDKRHVDTINDLMVFLEGITTGEE